MARGKRILQRLLFPAGWIVLVSVPLAAAGLIFVFAPANRGHWLTYPICAFSAYALTGGVVCTFILLLAIRMLICAARTLKMEETT